MHATLNYDVSAQHSCGCIYVNNIQKRKLGLCAYFIRTCTAQLADWICLISFITRGNRRLLLQVRKQSPPSPGDTVCKVNQQGVWGEEVHEVRRRWCSVIFQSSAGNLHCWAICTIGTLGYKLKGQLLLSGLERKDTKLHLVVASVVVMWLSMLSQTDG